jgi:hypothetical protein
MNASQFKFLRESLGLTHDWLSRNTGMKETDIFAWENGDKKVSSAAAELLFGIGNTGDKIEQTVVNIFVRNLNKTSCKRTAVLLRYLRNDDLWKYQPTFAPLSINTHNILLERVTRKHSSLGIKVIIVFMPADLYESWLKENKLDEDAASRAAWTATQVAESDNEDNEDMDIDVAIY